MDYNYQITIEYDGTKYVGWQFQKNGLSIQEVLEKKLKKLFKKNIKIIGAGRTDSGVHAMGQCANFFIDKKIENTKSFLNSINFFLNKHSISVINIKKKNLDFHSRHSAKERVYLYKITNRYSSLALNKNRTAEIKVPEMRLRAIASLKVKPIAMAIGAAANAVAPEITRPCTNSADLNLMCMNGILKVNGPHLIPLFFTVVTLFILIIQTCHPLGPLKSMETFCAPQDL